jgi:hypothetical protein
VFVDVKRRGTVLEFFDKMPFHHLHVDGQVFTEAIRAAKPLSCCSTPGSDTCYWAAFIERMS